MTAEYAQPLDIANRACIHLGAKLMSASDFYTTPVTQQGQSMALVYDKIRRAELIRNVWRFSIRRSVIRPIADGALRMLPLPWSATTVYERGAISSFGGIAWVSKLPGNVNNQPDGTGLNQAWDAFFGCPAVMPYDNATSYWIGETVYKSNNSGLIFPFTVTQDTTQGFINQASGQVQSSTPGSSDPSVPTQWVATTYYAQGDVVQFKDGFFYRSFIDVNYGNFPGTYNMFNASTTYRQNDIITGQDGMLYQSAVFSNLGNDPTTDVNHAFWNPTGNPNPWIPSFSGSACAQGWIRQNAKLTNAVPVYPVGAGPLSQGWNKNVFMLPFGYLRRAPQDPKAGVFPYLGAPNELAADDWTLEGDFLTSRLSFPIALRFAADITLVSSMDHMFCEGIAARLAFDTCEFITQSADKKRALGDIYTQYIRDARLVNGIETGPTDPPEDSFITCRL